ncbi:LacI family DNA-binding transcriptional regulator [Thalassovita sp.]|uniref:LacI family DNA-binding transcriptional regulator n=1 Tax=Thalassovita sp. TaxID=1979401 RepID=UPI002B2709CA|nr:LacI family DNA-binding transcriptional regulator [Thalassovita sp.]
MGKKVLLKDVALLAGVSDMTASRALRGASDVSGATKQKVEEAALSLDYVPNRIAGALASQRVNLVGVVVPSLSSQVFPTVLSGISDRLNGSPLKPVIGVSGYDLDEEEAVIREMLSWRPSGLIVAGLEHTDAARRMMMAADCPVIEIMDVDGDPVAHCVGISHIEAGRAMAREIVKRGYRRIGIVSTRATRDFRAHKRMDGFQAELSDLGLEPEDSVFHIGASSVETGRQLTGEILNRSPGLDCLYFSSDLMTIGAYMHCLAEGLSVPGDIALAGFNDLEMLQGLPLQLATADAHRFEIGQKAAAIVLDCYDRPGGEARTETLPPTIRPGQSI